MKTCEADVWVNVDAGLVAFSSLDLDTIYAVQLAVVLLLLGA